MSLLWNKTEIKEIDGKTSIQMHDSFYFKKEGKRYSPFIQMNSEFFEWDQVPILAEFFNKCNNLYQRFRDLDLMDLEYKCLECGVICKKREMIHINKEFAVCIRCANCKAHDKFELMFEDYVNSSAIVEDKEETLYRIRKRLSEAFPNAGWDQAPITDILSYCINIGSYISHTPEFLEVKAKEGLLKIIQSQIKNHQEKISIASENKDLEDQLSFENRLRILRQAILNNQVSTMDKIWDDIVESHKSASAPLIEKIATRIREEGKKNFNRSKGDQYIAGMEQGLDKAFRMIKNIIEGKAPQYTKLITEIEKKTDY